jgi:hypothetical protein
MQIDVDAANVLGYLLTGLVGVITWFMRQAFNSMAKQMTALHEEDKRLLGEIHELDKNSVTRDDFNDFKVDFRANFDRQFERLNDKFDQLLATRTK